MTKLVDAARMLADMGNDPDYAREEKNIEAAATAMRKAARSGVDLSPHVKVLRDTYHHAHDIGILQLVGDALVMHWLRVGDVRAFRRMLKAETYPEYLLRAIEHAEAAGVDGDPALPALVDAWTRNRLGTAHILADFVARKPQRLAAALCAMPSHGRGDLLKDLVLYHELDVTEALPVVLSGLRSRSPRVQEDAAFVLRLMAEAKLPLASVDTSVLRKSLEDETRMWTANALALSAAVAGDWARVDALGAASDPHVRHGVVRALGLAWLSFELDASSRVEAFVPDPDVGHHAVQILRTAERKGLRPLTVLDAGDPPCGICRWIPRSTVVNMESELPPEMSKLEESPLRCPKCGTPYHYEYEDEWDDMSHSETFTLKRLNPLSRKVVSKDKLLARLTHPDAWMRAEAAWGLAEDAVKRGAATEIEPLLRHASPEVRVEAGRVLRDADTVDVAPLLEALWPLLDDPLTSDLAGATLARHYAQRSDWDALRRMLAHPVALFQALQHLRLASPENADLSGFLPAALSLLQHDRESVRDQARLLVVRTGADVTPQIKALLRDDRPEVRKTAAETACNLAEEGRDVSAAAPELIAAMSHETAWFYSIKTLQALARCGHDISAAMPRAAEMLTQGTHLPEALALARLAIEHGWQTPQLVVGLASLLGRTRQQEAVGVLQSASEHGWDMEAAVPALRKLIKDGGDNWEREQATYALTRHWARRGDWKSIESLLRDGKRKVAGACARVLTEISEDWAPLLPALARNLDSKDWYDRGKAKDALDAYAARGLAQAEQVAALGERRGSGGRK